MIRTDFSRVRNEVRLVVGMVGLVLLAGCAGPAGPAPVAPDGTVFERVDGVTMTGEYSADEGLERWASDAPAARDVRITSGVDGTEPPALWQPPTGDGAAPLLVALHSWSSAYPQHNGIPFAQWAGQAGWGMIAPDFRGSTTTRTPPGPPWP